jgi:hypothetical protein
LILRLENRILFESLPTLYAFFDDLPPPLELFACLLTLGEPAFAPLGRSEVRAIAILLPFLELIFHILYHFY